MTNDRPQSHPPSRADYAPSRTVGGARADAGAVGGARTGGATGEAGDVEDVQGVGGVWADERATGEARVARATGGCVTAIEPDSPAARAGLVPGMVVVSAEDRPLRDVIEWRWLASDARVRVTAFDANGDAGEYTLTRTWGESWGIDFADPLFDGLMTCRNNCVFCFMTMLPSDMRPSLSERDDDYRLSFLQGNFVTLTNLDDAELERIITQRLSPLHVSLHAVSPDLRRRLMGKNHARGIEALERLLAADIEVHAQAVLLPGVNDGRELDATFAWIEQRPNIISVGVVPYGFTRHARIRESFGPEAARQIIERTAPWQERSRERCGRTRFQLADAWYLLADLPLPPAEHYDGYPQFEDGIGMLRSFEDEWEAKWPASAAKPTPTATSTATSTPASTEEPIASAERTATPTPALTSASASVFLVTGEAFAPTLRRLVTGSRPRGSLDTEVLAVRNDFFGGNVDVAGLLTAQDIIVQLAACHLPQQSVVALPDVLFNADGLTLDDRRAEDIAKALERRVIVVPCTAENRGGLMRNPETGKP